MNLSELRNLGAFVTNEPESVQVTWKGHTFDVFVRKAAYAEVERVWQAPEHERGAAMLASFVLLGDAKEPMTREDAARLDPELAAQLLIAVTKVNPTGAPEKN